MSEDESIKLRRQIAELQANLEQAHEHLAKMTYRFGTLAAVVGVAPDLPDREFRDELARLVAAKRANAVEEEPAS